MDVKQRLREIIERHCCAPKQSTIMSDLTIYKVEAPTMPTESVYSPRLCVVLQGSKTISLGGRTFEICDIDYFIATVNLPVSASIRHATTEKPHLAFTLELDREGIAEILPDFPASPPVSDRTALSIGQQNEDILEASLHLIRLLDRTDDLAVMARLAKSEIYYRLLQGEHAASLRQFATTGTNIAQVGKATAWIKEHYAEAMTIEDLAHIAGMSPTSLHRHFKAMTLMSPIEYRSLIRLQEARKRLLLRKTSAKNVGYEVGYDSQTQFTREYKRLFGRPPAQDAALLTGHRSAANDA
jgi:AraC-like DNA-binding protein